MMFSKPNSSHTGKTVPSVRAKVALNVAAANAASDTWVNHVDSDSGISS